VDDQDSNLFEGFFVPNLGWDEDDTPSSGWKKDENKEEGQTNQGRETCFKCGAKTVKVDTGMFSMYDVCPKCKI